MGISFIPGPAQTLAQPLAMFAEGLNNMINPNYRFQKAMQGIIAQRPDLIQQLADVEAATPGTLQKLGFGGLGQTIGQVPESAAGKYQRTNKEKIVKGQEAATAAETAKAQFTVEDLQGYGEFLKTNPDAKLEDYLRRTTGETQSQRDRRGANKAEAAATQSAIEGTPDLAAINLRDEARDFIRDPSYPSDKAASFFMNPATRDAFITQISQYNREHMTAYESASLATRGVGRENFRIQKAFQMYDQSNAGTLEAWEGYLFDDKKRERAKSLSTEPREKLDASDRDLVDVYKADQKMQLANRLSQSREYRVAVQNSVQQIRASATAGDQRSIDLQLTALNDVLDERSRFVGEKITAKYGKIPGTGTFFDDQGLFFVNDKNEVIPEGALYTDVPTGAIKPAPTQKELNAAASRALMDYMSKPINQRNAFLEALRAKNIDIYTMVKDSIDRQRAK